MLFQPVPGACLCPEGDTDEGVLSARHHLEAETETPRVITCRISTSNPYVGNDSAGYPAVWATGVTHCTNHVAEIAQTHVLYWGGTQESNIYQAH